jgi:hypothetical protein
VNSAGLVALLAGITALVTATVSGLTGWLRQHHQGKTEDKTSALSEIDIAWRISSEAIARLDRDVAMLNEKVRDTEERISRQAIADPSAGTRERWAAPRERQLAGPDRPPRKARGCLSHGPSAWSQR